MSAHIIPFPGAGAMPLDALPIEALLSAIPGLPRPVLARLTARMIDRLDEIDGDPDSEPNGDEQDHSDAEDEPFNWRFGLAKEFGPGCPISDPDYEENAP